MNWLRLHITNLCNFDCPGCHVFKLSKNSVAETNMHLETAESSILFFIELLKKYKLEGGRDFYISIYGGEPLLNRQVLYSIIKKFGKEYENIKINWIVNTNGSLLSEEDLLIFKLAEVDIHISLDGLEESHNKKRVDKLQRGTFKRVVRAIDLIRKNNYPWLQIDTVFNHQNKDSIYQTFQLAQEKGIKRIHNDFFYSSSVKENFDYEDYAVGYAKTYLEGEKRGLSIFASPFSQILRNITYNFQAKSVVSRFPSLEVFADKSFTFGELPLVKPFGKINQLSQGRIWFDRSQRLLKFEKELAKDCFDCPLDLFCFGEMKRIYRYHTLTNKGEEKICQIARKAIEFLQSNNFKSAPHVR